MSNLEIRRKYKHQCFDIVSGPGEMPLRIESTGGGVGMVYVIGAIVCFAAAFMIGKTDLGLSEGFYRSIEPYLSLPVIFLGIVMLLKGAASRLRKGQIEISSDEVHVVEPGIGRNSAWSEPLSAFEGVRWSKSIVRNSSDSGGGKSYLHVIDLAHPDKRIFVPLEMRTMTGEGPRKLWEDLASLLGLPAIDARDKDDVRVRAPEDVNKSVRQLAREGKIDASWDGQPPPDKVEVEYFGNPSNPEGKQIRLKLFEQSFPPKIAYPLAAALGVLAVTGFFQGAILISLILLVFASLTIWVMKNEARTPAQLTLTREDLTYVVNDVPQVKLKLDEIEIVKTRPGGVFVETDDGEKRIAGNLPSEAKNYVRDLVESALANT